MQVDPLRRQQAGIQALGDRTAQQIGGIYAGLGQKASQYGQNIANLSQQSLAEQQAISKSSADKLGQAANSADSLLAAAEDSNPNVATTRKQVAAQLALQSADNARLAATRESHTAAAGEAQQSFAAAMANAAQTGGAQAQSQARYAIQGRLGDISGQIADAQGPGRIKTLTDLRSQASNQMAAAQALGLNTFKAKTAADQGQQNIDVKKKALVIAGLKNSRTYRIAQGQLEVAKRNATSKSQRTQIQNRIDNLKSGYFKKHGYFPPTGPGKGKGSNLASPDQMRTNRQTWVDVVNFLKQPANKGYSVDDLLALQGAPKPPHGASVIYQIAKKHLSGKVGKQDRHTLDKLFPGARG